MFDFEQINIVELESEVSFGSRRKKRKKRRSRAAHRVASSTTGRGGNAQGATGPTDPTRRQRDAAQEAALARANDRRLGKGIEHIRHHLIKETTGSAGLSKRGIDAEVRVEFKCGSCHNYPDPYAK